MIDNVSDSSVMEMAQAITKTPQWLSKDQVRMYWSTQQTQAVKGFPVRQVNPLLNVFSGKVCSPKTVADFGKNET